MRCEGSGVFGVELVRVLGIVALERRRYSDEYGAGQKE